jgi:hypothetical protein
MSRLRLRTETRIRGNNDNDGFLAAHCVRAQTLPVAPAAMRMGEVGTRSTRWMIDAESAENRYARIVFQAMSNGFGIGGAWDGGETAPFLDRGERRRRSCRRR